MELDHGLLEMLYTSCRHYLLRTFFKYWVKEQLIILMIVLMSLALSLVLISVSQIQKLHYNGEEFICI